MEHGQRHSSYDLWYAIDVSSKKSSRIKVNGIDEKKATVFVMWGGGGGGGPRVTRK